MNDDVEGKIYMLQLKYRKKKLRVELIDIEIKELEKEIDLLREMQSEKDK